MENLFGTNSRQSERLDTPERSRRLLGIIVRLLGSHRWEYIGLLLLAMGISATEGICHPLLIKSIFDYGVMRGDFHRFSLLVLTYLVLGIAVIVANCVLSIWAKAFENRIVSSVGCKTLEAFYAQEYVDVLHRGEGYFLTHVYGDIREGLIPLLNSGQQLITQSVIFTTSLTILVYLEWKAFLLIVILIPVGAMIGTRISKRIRLRASEERSQEGAVVDLLSKALSAHRIVNGFGFGKVTVGAFADRMKPFLDVSYEKHRQASLFQAVSEATMVGSDAVSVFVGALFVLSGRLSFGGYLAFVSTFWRAGSALTQTSKRIGEYRSWEVMVRRIADFIEPRIKQARLVDDSVIFSNATIGYNQDAPIAQGLSLLFSPGERVVVVGANGAGKTTFANVLAGSLSQLSGRVAVPRRISAVTMPIAFPPLTVGQLVSNRTFLMKLGLADESVMGTYATELSSGQQQKVAIAMALSQKADLYIFDEPFASLDRNTRDSAIDLIMQEIGDATLIVIMHGFEEHYGSFDRVFEFGQPEILNERR